MVNGPGFALDLTRICHIWFSTDPNEALPSINKLRLIRKRLKNPNTTFNLIYSSKCLHEKALAELKDFAQRLDINLVDFHKDLVKLPMKQMDIDLYGFAKAEILHAKTNKGGSMAAASDMVRVLEKVIVNYGPYMDFDVDLDLQTLTTPQEYPVKAPVVMGAGSYMLGAAKIPMITNHFVGVALSEDKKSLHPQAIAQLNTYKQRVKDNYLGKNMQVLTTEFSGTPSEMYMFNPQLKEQILELYNHCAKNIIFYRNALKSLNLPETILQRLYLDTVSNITGPFAMFHMYQDAVKLIGKLESKSNMLKGFDLLTNQLEKAGYRQNGLANNIISKDNQSNMQSEYDGSNNGKKTEDIIGIKTDLSWSPLGSKILKGKSKKIDEAATKIQAVVRKHQLRRRMAQIKI